jgi:Ca-activated chloride channel homolog
MKLAWLIAPATALGVLLAPVAGTAAVPGDNRMGGRMTARIGERTFAFPTLKTNVRANVKGDLATVVVTQTFANPTNVPLNATYLFPLNKDAAVFAMTMEVGDEIVSAVIQKKAEARKTFETAKRAGKAAALLEQHRPNMFTQEIANLMPGLPVKVTLKYTQTVPRVGDAYELVVPLVVGPRYVPRNHRSTNRVAGLAANRPPNAVKRDDDGPVTPPAPVPVKPQLGTWQLGAVPKYPEVSGLTIPPVIDSDRVNIAVDLHSAIAVQSTASPSHALTVAGNKHHRTVALAAGKTIDNRDFVLRYRLAGAFPAAGLMAHHDTRGGYFSLLIEPPDRPAPEQTAARELVFILDTSGSMGGKPIAASKAFMRRALEGLRATDTFRIIQFSNNASQFTTRPIPATPGNVAAGLRYVDGLRAGGGTEMMTGLRLAYAAPGDPKTLRLVVFLSDGYVSNEPEILREVATNVKAGRMYAFGVGTSVNRYLIAEMARQGRGRYRIIDPTKDGDAAAISFADAIATPVLTDISIDWGTLKPAEVTPNRIPDLFAGGGIRLQGRYKTGGRHIINVKGRVNGRPATLPLEVNLPDAGTAQEAPATETASPIPLIWARARVADYMREMMVPNQMRSTNLTNDNIKQRVTRLGLDYAIVTQWTSFVAVAMKIVNPDPAATRDAGVPVPMVDGVGPGAYGLKANQRLPQTPNRGGLRTRVQPVPATQRVRVAFNTPGAKSFSGGATPEPEYLFGLGLIVLLLWLRFRNAYRRRAPLAV